MRAHARPAERTPSNPYQTAWALLALLAAGAGGSDAVRGGVEYLLRTQQTDGLWSDPTFTAPGFPRVFYLKYHGYCAYFPALGAGGLSQLHAPERAIDGRCGHRLRAGGRSARIWGPRHAAIESPVELALLDGTLLAVSGMGPRSRRGGSAARWLRPAPRRS